MRRFVAALFVLSIAACDSQDDEPSVVVRANSIGTSCAAGRMWSEGPVAEWLDSDAGIRTLERGCTWGRLAVDTMYGDESDEGLNFVLECTRNTEQACDDSVAFEDDVLWSEAICDICTDEPASQAACFDLLDPDGRC